MTHWWHGGSESQRPFRRERWARVAREARSGLVAGAMLILMLAGLIALALGVVGLVLILFTIVGA